MRKLSTGNDSTLENWITLCTMAFGEDSPATEFLWKKVRESPNGLQEEVMAEESQFIIALYQIHAEKDIEGIE